MYHVLAQPLQAKEVKCVLDWSRRLDHMQQHTGQHLLSAIFVDEYGYTTESFHLGTDYCSIDISAASLPTQEQQRVEERVNQLIFHNLPILTYNATPSELAQIPVRKLPDLDGDLRIVEIKGIDYSPCSGTHLDSTGQIGVLKIIKAEKYKGMTRVYFLCGQRALKDYDQKHKLCTQLVGLLAVPLAELPQRVQVELQHKRDLEKEIQDLQRELIAFKAQRIVANAQGPTLFLDLSEGTSEEAQQLARAILSLGNFYVVLNLGDRLMLTHNLPNGLHLGQLIKEQAQPLGGRGGGNATSGQVYFAKPGGKEEFQQFLRANLP